jgi:murein DD-endopeptidase MepM/ murein hydrolase activator NlpD
VRRTSLGFVAVAAATLVAIALPAGATQTATTTPTPTPPPATAPATPPAPVTTAPPTPPAPTPTTVSTPATPSPTTTKKKKQKPTASASPTPSPSGTAARKPDPKKKPPAPPDPQDSAQLIAAAQALQSAQDDLVSARATLTTARSELETAQTVARQARSDLQTAVVAEQRVTRELSAVESRVVTRTTDLGRLARASYQESGPFGEWQLVLELQSPDELTDRLAAMQSVASASNAVIADLRDDRSDLQATQAQFTAARRYQQEANLRAQQALRLTRIKEQAAAAAETQVGVVVAARQSALASAQKAIANDKVQYHALLAVSGALSSRIQEMAAKLAQGKNPPQGTGHFMRPGRGVVTSPYGMRYHPILHYVKLHTGTDFAADDGEAHAADDGVVLLTEYNTAYGNMTVIDHGTIGGLHVTTMYAHQAQIAVQPGQRVSKGQFIGVIGATGYATGPHLHFEVRIDGEPTDPAPWLVGAPMPPRATGPQ